MEELAGFVMTEVQEELHDAAAAAVDDDVTVDVTASKEPSWLLQFMRINYKCFLIFALTFLSAVMLLQTAVKEVLRDDQSSKLLVQLLAVFTKVYFPNTTVHEILIENME